MKKYTGKIFKMKTLIGFTGLLMLLSAISVMGQTAFEVTDGGNPPKEKHRDAIQRA